MLHDLRKMLATVGEKLGVSSAVLRRFLNHTAPKTDVLHRHYVGLDVGDGLVKIQVEMQRLPGIPRQATSAVVGGNGSSLCLERSG
jgi:hypothetical protein